LTIILPSDTLRQVDKCSTEKQEKEVKRMTNTELLMEYFKNSGLKLGFIAEKVGLSRYGLAKKINNDTEFKASEIEKLCELLHITSMEDRSRIFFAK
jgi:hypothetical protein